MVKKCVVCGKEFEGRRNSKYCSNECRNQAQKEKRRKYYLKNKEYYKEYNHKRYLKNKEYFKEHGRKYSLSHKEELKEYNKRYYLSHKKDKFRKCKVCGKTFKVSSKNHKYCSDKCREDMKKVYFRRYWEEKRKKGGCLMSNGNIRFTKNMVKSPVDCVGQTTCLECTRERCVYG